MKYVLNASQLAFLRSQHRQAAFVSGLGGGKSFALQLWTLHEAIKFPAALHCYCSISYRNLIDAAIPGFTRFLEENGIAFEYKAGGHQFIINGRTSVLFRSQEVADTMRSVEIGSLACDELAYWKEANFKTLLGRLRDKKGRCFMRASSTPNELNFFWKYFVDITANNRAIYRASTFDNKHLPEHYIQDLKDSYDTEMLAQELYGEFINLKSGRTYYQFDEKRNVKPTCKNSLPVAIGMDFNVNPMTAVECAVSSDTLYVFSERWLENSNTYEMGRRLQESYPNGATIIPDAAGNQRRSSATKTDHAILRDLEFEVPRVHNPHRKDRFNCVNNLLEKGRIIIDPSCRKLIRDLSMFCDDNANKELGHISDALGYVAWYYFPINVRRVLDERPVIL